MTTEAYTAVRDSLPCFISRVFATVAPGTVYLNNWHIKLLSEYLLACQRKEIKKLIINFPPRHGKSILTSVAFPAWLMGHDPTTQIMCASYAKSLSNTHSVNCRLVLEADWYKRAFPDTRLESDAVTKLITTARGHRIATSIGAKFSTGEGGDCLAHGTKIMARKKYARKPELLPIEYLVDNPDKYKVWSAKTLFGKSIWGWKKIVATKKSKPKDMYLIITQSGRQLKCTGDHRIFVTGNIWHDIPVSNLLNSMNPVVTYDIEHGCHTEYINTVMRYDYTEEYVYDIQVQGHHNFVANGLLVHNCLIIDDPISAADQFSILKREEANAWHDQVWASRLNNRNTGVSIVIMQRLHENDLSGYLLEKGGWEHLRIPLIEDQENKIYSIGKYSYSRPKGELLHRARLNEEQIAEIKHDLGPYAYAGQYQQTPSPEGGGKFRFEWLKYYENPQWKHMNVYIFVDPADSKHKTSDYTAIMVVGANKDGNLYILDIIRDRLNLKEREDMVFNLHAKYEPKGFYYQKYFMESDIQHMQSAMNERNYRFTISPLTVKLPKEDRISRLIPLFADGKIYLPRYLHKTGYDGKMVDVVNEFINKEYLLFNASAHDDLLDALSMVCFVNVIYPGRSTVNYNELYKDVKW